MKLARLARLELTDDEVETFRSQLSEILQYVEQLQQADVGDPVPTNQVTGLTNVMREDTVREYGYEADDLLGQLPAREGRQIKVRRMIA